MSRETLPTSVCQRKCGSVHSAARMRSSGFMVFTPITSRYRTIEISAIADGMTTKAWKSLAEVGDQEQREQVHEVADAPHDEHDAEPLGEPPC